ncbi:MAG: GNAT family N-acetyltransferase [Candidatus Bathyarchaeota archaeon]|jgi:GNAT superfamily N-acetyltransferase
MELKYRFLTLVDLLAIRELSDSMGIWNDPKIGETAEGRIKDTLCDLYGAFTEDGELVGTGAFRTLTEDYAWIEAVRIHGKYQKQGIGTKIFNYGEELARKRNCKTIAYQTVTENRGSCRIGEKLGFTRSHEMTAFCLQQKEIIKMEDSPKLEPIPAKEAISLMRKIPNAQTHEICIGWDYRPLVAEIFDDNLDMNFFIHEDTLALEVRERNSKAGEVRWVKAIIYGNEKSALLLLNNIRGRNVGVSWFFCLVPKTLESTIERTDFKYGKVWTGKKNIVVLFKKYL